MLLYSPSFMNLNRHSNFEESQLFKKVKKKKKGGKKKKAAVPELNADLNSAPLQIGDRHGKLMMKKVSLNNQYMKKDEKRNTAMNFTKNIMIDMDPLDEDPAEYEDDEYTGTPTKTQNTSTASYMRASPAQYAPNKPEEVKLPEINQNKAMIYNEPVIELPEHEQAEEVRNKFEREREEDQEHQKGKPNPVMIKLNTDIDFSHSEDTIQVNESTLKESSGMFTKSRNSIQQELGSNPSSKI